MKKRRKISSLAHDLHVRDRIEVALTPALEEALRKKGPFEPSLTTSEGHPLYAVCIMVGGGQRVAALSSVPPLDDKETCPQCGSQDFWKTQFPFNAWCPDPNRRACRRCQTRWDLCGNGLPLVDLRFQATGEEPTSDLLRASDKAAHE